MLLEHPLTSRFCLLPQMHKLNFFFGGKDVICDFCQYGVPWLKPTEYSCFNFLSDFELLRCSGSFKQCSRSCQPHTPLSGTCDGLFLTKLAEPYPDRLCIQIATACSQAVSASTRKYNNSIGKTNKQWPTLALSADYRRKFKTQHTNGMHVLIIGMNI